MIHGRAEVFGRFISPLHFSNGKRQNHRVLLVALDFLIDQNLQRVLATFRIDRVVVHLWRALISSLVTVFAQAPRIQAKPKSSTCTDRLSLISCEFGLYQHQQ